MSNHVHDELPLLLRGEADRETVNAAAEHLRGCEDCRLELTSALVAHASLASAARYTAPAVLDADEPATGENEVPAGDLPDLSDMFARVRAESAEIPRSLLLRSRPRRMLALVAATVAGLIVGAGAVAAVEHTTSSKSVRTVQLAAYDKGSAPATAKVVDGQQMKIDLAALPAPGAGKLYEVWLTNAARTKLYAVGSLGAGRTGSFTIAPSLMLTYSAIEVSVQPLTDSSYSGVSVLRGSYA